VSRKDPRRVLMVPLSAELRAALRAEARGRSLGDRVRRLMGPALAGEVPEVDVPGTGGCLPVQLPKRDRARLAALAQARGIAPERLCAGLLARSLGVA